MPEAKTQTETPTADEFTQRLNSMLNGDAPAAKPPNPQEAQDAAAEQSDAADTPPQGTGDHVVKDGECISSIARETGHFWQRLWDEPANAELKAVRRQPNVLMAGDRVTVPPIQTKSEPGASEMRHRFVRRGEPSHLALRVLDQDVPRANEPYTLVIDGKQEITGVTDAEGKLDIPIPGNANKGKLTVGVEPDLLEYDLDLGGLDPVESWKGVQTRLKNLGIACDVTGEKDDQTMDAVNEFRGQNGLPASEELDEATRARLQEKHGS